MTGPRPTDLAGRRAARARIRRQHIAEAELKAHRTARSITCGEYERHETCAGASYCLCECHDPEEGA